MFVSGNLAGLRSGLTASVFDVFRRTLDGSSSQISQTFQDDARLLVGDSQRSECRCQGNDILGVKLIF